MEPIMIAAIVAIALVIAIFLWQMRRLARTAPRLKAYNRYHALRRQVFVNGAAARSDASAEADAIVNKLGPIFDPRVSGWERLRLLEPNLRVFVTGHIYFAAEEQNDLEAFAETILGIEAGGFRFIAPREWLQAAKDFALDAATWRTMNPPTGKGLDTDTAFEEAVVVARRYYAFGSRGWDRRRAVAVAKYRDGSSGQ